MKLIKKYSGTGAHYEVISIEGVTMVQEFLFTDVKAVWSIWKADIFKDLKWKEVLDYIKKMKKLGFKELKDYKDNLVWINPNTGKKFKQYEFEMV